MKVYSVFDREFRRYGLLAHPDRDEAKSGAVIGLKGENIDIAGEI